MLYTAVAENNCCCGVFKQHRRGSTLWSLGLGCNHPQSLFFAVFPAPGRNTTGFEGATQVEWGSGFLWASQFVESEAAEENELQESKVKIASFVVISCGLE